MNAAAKFYGIGVGPGDPELITRKAARVLAEVDWIFLPITTGNPLGFAGAIVESLQLDAAKFRPVKMCMSRERATDQNAYDHAAEEIAQELKRGQSAAWITEGDPLFFSTFLHVWSALQIHLPGAEVEIIPGIMSVQAAAACAATPIATLDERVAVVPAAYGLHHLRELLEEFAVVFLLKVHGVFEQFLDMLAAMPVPVRAIYVEKAGTAQERIVRDLTLLRGQKIPYFSLVILRRAPKEGGQA